jgi:hypothetical protein
MLAQHSRHPGRSAAAGQPRQPISSDRTNLVDGIERQLQIVRSALGRIGAPDVHVRGALCFPYPDGLPLFKQLTIRGIAIDGTRPWRSSPAGRARWTTITSRRSGASSPPPSHQPDRGPILEPASLPS